MPWGTSEGGIPQPYRMAVESAHWEKARNRDGELVETRGENLMNLVFEGQAYRLVEEEDGSFSQGELIEPVDGKVNRRSFLIGNTSQWVDPREDGKKIESVRGPDELPWGQSEIGHLVASLVETVGADELEKSWGPWEEAATWSGKTYDFIPKHDLDSEGKPKTHKTRAGDERISWYFVIANVDEGVGAAPATAPKRGRGKKAEANGDLTSLVTAAYKSFEGNEDEFVDFIQSDDFAQSGEVAKLSDEEFDALVEKAVS